MKMKRFFALALVLMLLAAPALASSLKASDDFYVNDAANVLSDATIGHIVLNNDALYKACGAQLVFVTVDTTGSTKLENYAYKLFNDWGVGGSNNNGFLLVMAIQDDDYWYEIGKGLDQYLTSGDAGELVDKYLEPYFAKKDYDGGAKAFFDALFATTARALKANVSIDNSAYSKYIQQNGGSTATTTTRTTTGNTTPRRADESDGSWVLGLIVLIAIIVIVVLIVHSTRRRRVVRTGGTTVVRPTVVVPPVVTRTPPIVSRPVQTPPVVSRPAQTPPSQGSYGGFTQPPGRASSAGRPSSSGVSRPSSGGSSSGRSSGVGSIFGGFSGSGRSSSGFGRSSSSGRSSGGFGGGRSGGGGVTRGSGGGRHR
ncbi:MAG: TPM domain-containing protein [Clostridia bacterium]|nr:TPM domain-containing protein [Clostridia bacterium]